MINGDKYDRTISLRCPTCGGTDFEYDVQSIGDDASPVKCASCGLATTKGELIAANGESIENQLDDIKDEVAADIKKSLKEAFKGNKFIKIK